MPAFPARAFPPEDDRSGADLRLVHDSDPDLLARRAESLDALAQLLCLLGYPPEWAVELEQQAFARGTVWKVAKPPA